MPDKDTLIDIAIFVAVNVAGRFAYDTYKNYRHTQREKAFSEHLESLTPVK